MMSNHYQVVLHVNDAEARNADGKVIVERWRQIHNGTEVTKKYSRGEPLETHEREQVHTLIDSWRLHSISWFMREVNEKIVRLANKGTIAAEGFGKDGSNVRFCGMSKQYPVAWRMLT